MDMQFIEESKYWNKIIIDGGHEQCRAALNDRRKEPVQCTLQAFFTRRQNLTGMPASARNVKIELT